MVAGVRTVTIFRKGATAQKLLRLFALENDLYLGLVPTQYGNGANRCRENVEPVAPTASILTLSARSHPVSSVACNDQRVRR